MTYNTIPLSELKIGTTGIITRINLQGPFKRRLMEMGLVQGEYISARRVAPMGDPIAYSIKGYQLSLRREDAQHILIQIEN